MLPDEHANRLQGHKLDSGRISPRDPKALGVRARVVMLGCVLGLLGAGCGRADDRRTVGAVTERFLDAVHAREGARACAQLSPGAASALEQDAGKRCTKAVVELNVSPAAVRRAQVFEIGAQVDLADGESAFLELTRRGWRVSAAGCKPEGADQPYRCEVKG